MYFDLSEMTIGVCCGDLGIEGGARRGAGSIEIDRYNSLAISMGSNVTAVHINVLVHIFISFADMAASFTA